MNTNKADKEKETVVIIEPSKMFELMPKYAKFHKYEKDDNGIPTKTYD